MEVRPVKASSLGSYRTVTVKRANMIVEFPEGGGGLVCVSVGAGGSSFTCIRKSIYCFCDVKKKQRRPVSCSL